MIVHRVIHNGQDDHHLPSSHLNFQNGYPSKTIQAPKLYFNERSQSYSVSSEKHRDRQAKYGKIAISQGEKKDSF